MKLDNSMQLLCDCWVIDNMIRDPDGDMHLPENTSAWPDGATVADISAAIGRVRANLCDRVTPELVAKEYAKATAQPYERTPTESMVVHDASVAYPPPEPPGERAPLWPRRLQLRKPSYSWASVIGTAIEAIVLVVIVGGILSTCHGSEVLDVPSWCLRGILSVESSSYYGADGRIVYVNRVDGEAGEVSAFQLKRSALKDIHLLSHRAEIRRDPAFAEYAATLYLRLCFRHTGTWPRAVAMYHTGSPAETPEGFEYFREVNLASQSAN